MVRLTWPRLEPRDFFWLSWALVAGAAARAWDLTFPVADSTLYRITPVGEIGQYAWAVAFAAGVVFLIVGLVARLHYAVWLGHGLLGTTYTALLFGMLIYAWINPAHLISQDLRWIGALGPVALLNWLLWLRMGAKPEPEDGP